jgi:hypothetical protein
VNKSLFREVRNAIASKPLSFNPRYWADRAGTRCGTVACVAGWTCAIAAKVPLVELTSPSFKVQSLLIKETVKSLLWLDDDEANVLFTGFPEKDWPEPFASEWRGTRSPRRRVAIALRYFDQILETDSVY